MHRNTSFEDWWSKKSHLLPANLKDMFGIAFKDGWYRAEKAMKANSEVR
jgi:hypothetical protein